jgi:hypothetical protein
MSGSASMTYSESVIQHELHQWTTKLRTESLCEMEMNRGKYREFWRSPENLNPLTHLFSDTQIDLSKCFPFSIIQEHDLEVTYINLSPNANAFTTSSMAGPRISFLNAIVSFEMDD